MHVFKLNYANLISHKKYDQKIAVHTNSRTYCILSYSAWIPMHVLTRKARVIVPRQYQAVLCGVKENTTSLRADIVVELWHAF